MTPVVGWGASYGMMWDTRVDGDQLLDAAGPYQFNHWWLFNIYNRSGNSLPAPKISATLDGSLSGIDAGMSPPDPNITLTKTGTNAEWSMNQLAPGGQPGGGMQGTLWTTTTTQPITDSYTLGFDAMRQLSKGRVVAGGASGEPRTFTMTVIAHDATLSDIGTSIGFAVPVRHDDGVVLGRVYHIRFSASDGQSTCNGEVIVTVPHDRRGVAVDEGALYDSTVESLPAGHSHNDGCKDDDHERRGNG